VSYVHSAYSILPCLTVYAKRTRPHSADRRRAVKTKRETKREREIEKQGGEGRKAGGIEEEERERERERFQSEYIGTYTILASRYSRVEPARLAEI